MQAYARDTSLYTLLCLNLIPVMKLLMTTKKSRNLIVNLILNSFCSGGMIIMVLYDSYPLAVLSKQNKFWFLLRTGLISSLYVVAAFLFCFFIFHIKLHILPSNQALFLPFQIILILSYLV